MLEGKCSRLQGTKSRLMCRRGWSLLYESQIVCSQQGETCFHVKNPSEQTEVCI